MFWIPEATAYKTYSSIHPTISAYDYFNVYDLNKLEDAIKSDTTPNFLRDSSVKYVVLPEDINSKIFLTDRKYDNSKYLQTLRFLQSLAWLKEVKSFGKIVVV